MDGQFHSRTLLNAMTTRTAFNSALRTMNSALNEARDSSRDQSETHKNTKVRFVRKVYRQIEGIGKWCEVISENHLKNPNIVRVPDQIIPGLYIGDWRDAVNPLIVYFLGITHILSIAGIDNYVQYKRTIPQGVELLMFCVEDNVNSSIMPLIPLALDFIHKGRCTGNTLVHCVAGISRSASFCCAYLMREQGVSYDYALAVVQNVRPLCLPNPGFEAQLRQYEVELNSVLFSVHFHTKLGETLHVVGDSEVLGNWRPTEKNRMTWVGDGLWEIKLPVFGKFFQYKYVVVSTNIDSAVLWEPCPNRNTNSTRMLRDTWGVHSCV